MMKLFAAIIAMLLVAGCRTEHQSSRPNAQIADSLERQITEGEARRIVVGPIDHSVHIAELNPSATEELELLSKMQKRLTSKLDSFLSLRRAGDQLWSYRTFVTPDGRGGENGIALVRNGEVVEQLTAFTFD